MTPTRAVSRQVSPTLSGSLPAPPCTRHVGTGAKAKARPSFAWQACNSYDFQESTCVLTRKGACRPALPLDASGRDTLSTTLGASWVNPSTEADRTLNALLALEQALVGTSSLTTTQLAATGSTCSTVDSDGDGVLDLYPGTTKPWDSNPMNNLVCGDLDGDGCDDCSMGMGLDVMNDGPDSDGDGVCDLADNPPVILTFLCEGALLGGTSMCSGSFVDVDGFEGHAARASWGDGTTAACSILRASPGERATGLVACSHAYVVEGCFVPTLMVSDGGPGFNEVDIASTLPLCFDAEDTAPTYLEYGRKHDMSGAQLNCQVEPDIGSISVCSLSFLDPARAVGVVAADWVRA
jgi:hypothetical protein